MGDNGLLEIKCPNTVTQIQRYLKGEFPTEYKAQVQGQLWVSERDWCDFVSFDPRINTSADYFQVRVYRDEDYIFNLAGQVSHIDSMEDPFTDLEINCRSQLSILEACRHNNPEVKIVFAGTRQQYGKPDYLPVDGPGPATRVVPG